MMYLDFGQIAGTADVAAWRRVGLGTAVRGRLLLQLIASVGPAPDLQAAYFDNLDRLLAGRPALARPGRLVLGLGTGRCGSTTVTHLLGSAAGVCATHENPPLIHWRPAQDQVDMHLRRFARLRRHFPVVFDAAHWWLNAAPALLAACPDVRFVGLLRDAAATVRSFLHVKGVGPGSLNHWVRSGQGPWRRSTWDGAYPDYPHPPLVGPADGSAKADLIGRYVTEYQAGLRAFATADPDRTLLVRTEALGEPTTQRRLYDFVGVPDGMFADLRLNAGTVADGGDRYKF